MSENQVEEKLFPSLDKEGNIAVFHKLRVEQHGRVEQPLKPSLRLIAED